ncbi:MAG: hypothetical protein RLZZ609_2258 [Cyanobacteriota bacterium]|jgi:hypothetical protein
MLPFPSNAPYRIDQVGAAPLLLALLTAAILVTATLMSSLARPARLSLWAAAGAVLLGEVTVLFGLASWGTSDVTKLSHYFAVNLRALQLEPFWIQIAPLIVWLPYRMALVHGLVSAGYAALGLGLARRWQALAWGPWWALLMVFSPFLYNFLQSGVSRQALVTLLLVPLLLWAGQLAPVGRGVMALLTLWAATVHGGFVLTALLALVPRGLVSLGRADPSPVAASPSLGSAGRGSRRPLLLALVLLGLAGLLALVAPMLWSKLHHYTMKESFFNSYALSPQVVRLQLALGLGTGMVCWVRRLGWRQLLACRYTRQLAFFGVLFALIQQCLRQDWLPSFTSRFADPVGLFLLIVYLAWLERYRSRWAVLPALAVTLDFWLLERLPDALTLRCGQDDAFLCVPDRWPWQVRWQSPP